MGKIFLRNAKWISFQKINILRRCHGIVEKIITNFVIKKNPLDLDGF